MKALSEWFVQLHARPAAPRLICFPYAGAGAAVFRSWAAGLGDAVEVVVARLPGRESRINEPALADACAIATAATRALSPLIEREPQRAFALFGHSLGAIVAFEVARALERQRGATPRALFASGCRAPSWRDPEPPVARLPRDRFIAELHELAGTPREVLENDELMDLLLPMLRADFAAAEDYVRPAGPPIGAPIYVYAGETDDDLPPEGRVGWTEESTSACTTRLFAGGHFFVDSQREQVWEALRHDLTELFGGRSART